MFPSHLTERVVASSARSGAHPTLPRLVPAPPAPEQPLAALTDTPLTRAPGME